jgi:hypothetical protein
VCSVILLGVDVNSSIKPVLRKKHLANIHWAGMTLEQYYLQMWKYTRKDEWSHMHVTDTLFFLLHFSTPDPDNVLIVKTPDGVFSTKFLLQNNGKQSPAQLTNNENHQVFPAKSSDCPAARCLPYDMLRNKVFSIILVLCAPPLFLHQIVTGIEKRCVIVSHA